MFLRGLGEGEGGGEGKGEGDVEEGEGREREGEGRWMRIKARMWMEAIVDLWEVRKVDGQ